MPAAGRDRVLRALLIALVLDTAVSMGLSLAGLTGSGGGAGGQGVRGWIGLVWFGLLVAVLWRSARHIRQLRRLVSTRDDQIAAVAATSHEWLWEATPILHPVPDLIATYCSPAISSLLGRTPEEIVGHPLLEFVFEQDLPAARTILANAIRGRTGWQDVELRWRHADGALVSMLGSALPVLDNRRNLVGYRGTRRLAATDTAIQQRLAGISHRVAALLATESLPIALQPIVSLASGDWIGVEALSRFPDNRAPDRWFAEAHEAGLGVDLELAAVHAALATLPELPDHIRLAVNASPELILDPRLPAALTGTGVPLQRIVIEITEHAEVADYPDIQAALLPLREHGLALAVDDAGAGYASFTHVLHLRPDVIKLDRSLIADIHDDLARRAFVTAIVLLALELGATVTAEGIEALPELSALADLGVDHGQGYLLARPSTDPRRWHSWRNRTWPTAASMSPYPSSLEPPPLSRNLPGRGGRDRIAGTGTKRPS